MIDSDGLYDWPGTMQEPKSHDANLESWLKYNPFADAPEDHHSQEKYVQEPLKLSTRDLITSEYCLSNRVQREIAERGLNDIIRREQKVTVNIEDFASLLFIDPDMYNSVQQYFSATENVRN